MDVDDSSDAFRHESVPRDMHTWRTSGYDALEFIRHSEPWVWSSAAEEIKCFYCDNFITEKHADTCVWKRSQGDED